MRLPQYFIERPIFATVISVVIVLLGVLSMWKLPISEYPEVVPPNIQIQATYPGASPETIAATVASPLEQQMTGLDGLLYINSQSTPDGSMALVLTFALGTDLDKQLVEVQNRVQKATPRLPDDVRRLGVVATKATLNLLMVVHLQSEANGLDPLALANYARLYIKDQLARLPGISDVPVFGAGEYSLRVWLDPERMAARGLAPADIAEAIREQNTQVAAGVLAQQPVAHATAFELTITTQGRLVETKEFEDIIVAHGANGQLVRLRDVARVELGADSYGLRSLLNNKAATAMPIIQIAGSNALEISNNVRAKMAELAKAFPAGVRYEIVYDPTDFIRESIRAVVETLIDAIILVVIVVIVFLQTWRASIIPLVAVPVSIIGTFAIMLALGFTINSLSLFGLVLAIGIVVDDAIVVVENVERNIALGLNPLQATRQAMREVSGPILATALVLCSVFIPTAFISGLTGRFYQQFALTIAISTAISAFNSLTLSPALAALLLRSHAPGRHPGGMLLGWFFSAFNYVFGASANAYVGTIRRVLRLSVIALLFYAIMLFGTVKLFQSTPTAFIPEQDKGYLIGFAKLADGASLDRSDAVVHQMGDIALRHPAIDGAVAFSGMSLNGFHPASNSGVVFIRLRDYKQRTAPGMAVGQVQGALMGPLMGIQDAFAMAVPTPPILGLGNTSGFKLYLEDRGNVGTVELYKAADAVLAAAHHRKELSQQTYTFSTLGVPRLQVDVDREKVLSQGLKLNDIYDAMQGYFGTIYVNDFNRFGRTWQVNIQGDADYRSHIADFQRVKIKNAQGAMVPLASFIRINETAGTDSAVQYNTFPAIDINSGAAQGYSSDQAQDAMAEVLAQTLPPGVTYEWTELTYQQILAGNTAIYVFPVCVLLVFLVLAAFYESLTLPLAIVLIVPMCLFSALVGVNLIHGDNNIMTQIGLIVLVGLACKNAILIVEFAKEAEVDKGMDPYTAAIEACRLRLRPILMTSMAFIMGVVPLVLATGAGAELRHSTGTAVFAGMIGVTFFGLLLTPVFYVTLRRLSPGKLRGHHEQDQEKP